MAPPVVDPWSKIMTGFEPHPIEMYDGHPCWEWKRNRVQAGYARVYSSVFGKHKTYVHRLMYERFVGPVPRGLHIDHLCRNRWCVNPKHMEPVTRKENILRGVGITAQNVKKTHCVNGHEFTPDNTYPNGTGRGCKICRREHNRRHYEKSRRDP